MEKAVDAFRTISEVAEDLDLPQHVLRFWETRFRQIKPMKRGGGRRYYRPEDVDLLRGIKGLLYDEGYTIRGVQRLLKEHGNRVAIEFGQTGSLNMELDTATSPGDGSISSPAMDVSEISSAATRSKKSPGILGRIASRAVGSSADDVGDEAGLGAKEREILKSTLHELLECKRLLDQTRQN